MDLFSYNTKFLRLLAEEMAFHMLRHYHRLVGKLNTNLNKLDISLILSVNVRVIGSIFKRDFDISRLPQAKAYYIEIEATFSEL